MPSKLKKAIGAVKDQTSISLAKVVNTNSASLEVAILKATSHDKSPIDDRHLDEILKTVSSNKLFAGIAARAIVKRLTKTKNWIVALKCLMLVLRIFQDGDPYFPKEVLHAMDHRGKSLNIPSFRDESSSRPCDDAAFVKSFAVYLEVRLECFLTGKLQRRFTFKEKQLSFPRSRRVNQQPVRLMKPPMLLDRISYWQRLLDKAIATKPTGSAKKDLLVLVSFNVVVQESFDLYRDISDGLGLILDGFFHLQHQLCVNAIEYCVKATKQFEDLLSFYGYCKSLGMRKTSDYPSVKMISHELVETLKEFVKDTDSFPSSAAKDRSPHLARLLSSASKNLSFSEVESQTGSTSTLGDLMRREEGEEEEEEEESVNGKMRSSISVEDLSELSKQQFHEQEDRFDAVETGSNHSLPVDQDQNACIDFISFNEWPTEDYASNDHQTFIDNCAQQDHRIEQASPNGVMANSYIDDWLVQHHHPDHDQASNDVANRNSGFDDLLKEDETIDHASKQIVMYNGLSDFDDWLPRNESSATDWSNNGGSSENWELVLVGATQQPSTPQASQHLVNGFEFEPSMANDSFDQTPIVPQRKYNPFLEDETVISAPIATGANDIYAGFSDGFSMAPTFFAQSCNEMRAPTFRATPASVSQNSNGTVTMVRDVETDDDGFAPWPMTEANNNNGLVDQQSVLLQQLWLE